MVIKRLTFIFGALLFLKGVSSRAEEQTPMVSSVRAPKDRFLPLFKPFQTDHAALSPDGKYLAYTLHQGTTLQVVVGEIDHPSVPTTTVTVAADTVTMLGNTQLKTPAALRWMRWVSPTRIVVETNANFPVHPDIDKDWEVHTGAIIAFDFDGKNARSLATPFDVGEKPPPVDFGPPPNGVDLTRKPDQPFLRDESPMTPPEPIEKLPHEDYGPRSRDLENRFPNSTKPPGATNPVLGMDPFLPPPNIGPMKPRSVKVFDLAAGDSKSVIIRTADPHSYDVYRVDVNSGKLHDLLTESIPLEDAPLVDRQGRARVIVPAMTSIAFPHRYSLARQALTSRWTALDRVASLHGAGFSLSPENFLGERAIPLGFDEDPNFLYYASNIGRDTYGIYSLNLKTGQRGSLVVENPAYDMIQVSLSEFPDDTNLVYDRFTRKLQGIRFEARYRTAAWLVPELRAAQHELETFCKGESVDILEWDSAYKRMLVLVRSQNDAGAYYIYDRETAKLSQFARRAPWIDQKQTQPMLDFAFDNPHGGGAISGYVTLPRAVRIQPMPIVVICPPEPWQRTQSEYSGDVHALAEMGMAVVQFNGRGAWGFGIKQREAAKQGYDQAQVEDIISTLDYLIKEMKFLSPKFITILGEGRGGYLALRAMQIDPNRFRCGIAINPTVDLPAWINDSRWQDQTAAPALIKSYFGKRGSLNERPLQKHPELITQPLCIFGYPGLQNESSSLSYREARFLATQVSSPDVPVEFHDLTEDYANSIPQARSDIFDQIETFLNTYLYNYKVKIKETKVIDQ